MRKERFEEHIGLIYQSIGNDTGWDIFLTQLIRDLEIRSALISVDDTESKGIYLAASAGISQRDVALMTHEFQGMDVWTNKLHNLPSGILYASEDMVSERELYKTDFYNDLCRLVDLRYSCGGVVDFNKNHSMRIALQAAHDQEPFSESSSYLNRLLPHIQQAVKLHQKVESQNVDTANMSALINKLPDANALIDRSGEIIYTNLLFETLLTENSWLTTNNNLLTIKHAPDLLTKATNKLLNQRFRINGEKTISATIKQHTFNFELVDTGESIFNMGIHGVNFLLSITFNSNDNTAKFVKKYGLTPKEITILKGLKGGFSLIQIAEQHYRSIHTIKTHLTSIFRKTGTNSQARLLALLSKE